MNHETKPEVVLYSCTEGLIFNLTEIHVLKRCLSTHQLKIKSPGKYCDKKAYTCVHVVVEGCDIIFNILFTDMIDFHSGLLNRILLGILFLSSKDFGIGKVGMLSSNHSNVRRSRHEQEALVDQLSLTSRSHIHAKFMLCQKPGQKERIA